MSRRLVLVVAVLATAGLCLAATSVAATSVRGGGAAGAHPAAVAKLPALPPYVKKRQHWVIGVKCDFPPFGYIDYQGNNRGYDVAVARRFATLAFGRPNRIRLKCVTTPSRIPTLQAGLVDIIVSTLTWTAARAQVIDYSIPYYSATGRLLVPNNSNLNIHNLAGKTIVTTRGAIYATWVRNCFKSSNLLEVDGTAAAVLAVKEGRADTFMFDDAFNIGVATQDPTLKLTNDKFLNVPWGIGIRKGDTAMARWVNAAIRYMAKRGEFDRILKSNVPKRYVSSFLGNVPGKNRHFAYPIGKDPSSDCSGVF
jgi:polar amino acid transport system substrate-binding protein